MIINQQEKLHKIRVFFHHTLTLCWNKDNELNDFKGGGN